MHKTTAIRFTWSKYLKHNPSRGLTQLTVECCIWVQQTFDEVELLRNCDCNCDFACMRCCRCISSNCWSLAAKLIPLGTLSISRLMSPSSMICDPLGIWCKIWEYELPGDVRLICSLLREYEGTVFNRVRSILKAALCCNQVRLDEMEIEHRPGIMNKY